MKFNHGERGRVKIGTLKFRDMFSTVHCTGRYVYLHCVANKHYALSEQDDEVCVYCCGDDTDVEYLGVADSVTF